MFILVLRIKVIQWIFLELVTLSRKLYLAKTNVYLVGFWDLCIFVLVQIYYIFLSQTQCIHFSGTVSEAEEHHQWFKESAVSAEGGFPFISLFHVDIIEIPSDVQLCEVSCPSEFLYQLGDERKRVFVLHHDGIQSTVVLY